MPVVGEEEMTAEGLVKQDIKKGLTARGIYYFMPVQTGYGKRSVDFICCWKGRFLAIEAKAGKNQISKIQESTLNEMRLAGAITVVAYAWADVERALSRVFPKDE